jgi:hypothetical protein
MASFLVGLRQRETVWKRQWLSFSSIQLGPPRLKGRELFQQPQKQQLQQIEKQLAQCKGHLCTFLLCTAFFSIAQTEFRDALARSPRVNI